MNMFLLTNSFILIITLPFIFSRCCPKCRRQVIPFTRLPIGYPAVPATLPPFPPPLPTPFPPITIPPGLPFVGSPAPIVPPLPPGPPPPVVTPSPPAPPPPVSPAPPGTSPTPPPVTFRPPVGLPVPSVYARSRINREMIIAPKKSTPTVLSSIALPSNQYADISSISLGPYGK